MSSKGNERAKRAVEAMKPLGFSRKLTVEVLKRLLSVYSNNWELIEDDNYRALADAILDAQENGNEEETGRNKEPVPNRAQPNRPIRPSPQPNHTRAHEPGPQENQFPSQYTTGAHEPGPQENQLPSRYTTGAHEPGPQGNQVPSQYTTGAHEPGPQGNQVPSQYGTGAREPGPSSSRRERGSIEGEEETEAGTGLVRRKRLRKNSELVQRETVPVSVTGMEPGEIVHVTGTERRDVVLDFPSEMTHRSTQVGTSQGGTSTGIDDGLDGVITYQRVHFSKRKRSKPVPLKEPKLEPGTETEVLNNVGMTDNRGNQTNHQDTVPASRTGTELLLSSSSNGQIQLAFQFPFRDSNLRAPSLDEFFKLVENRNLESFTDFRILNPGFSIPGFLNEMCQLMADEVGRL